MTTHKTTRRRYARKPKGEKLATVRQVKSLIRHNTETKYLQSQQRQGSLDTLSYADWNGVIQQINLIPQGDDVGQRVGDQIRMHNIRLNFSIVNASANFTRVRLILFTFRQERTGAPVVPGDILAEVGNTQAVISSYNWRNQSAYSILWDKVFTVSSSNGTLPISGTAGAVGGAPCINGSIRKRLKNMIVQYAGGSLTDPTTKGYLGLLWVSDVSSAAISSQKPQVMWHQTMRYTDA